MSVHRRFPLQNTPQPASQVPSSFLHFTLCCGNYLPWEISPIAINRCARIYCDDNSPDSCDCDSKLCSTGKGHISVHSDQCYRSLPNWKQLLLPAHRGVWPLTFKRWQWRDPPSSFILAVDLFPKTPSLSPAPFSSIFLFSVAFSAVPATS